MESYKEVSQSKYAKVIAYYTWVLETDPEQKYHFGDKTPGTYLEVGGQKLNLFITDDFYKENSIASYEIMISDGIAYLSMAGKNYIIKSIVIDSNNLSAKMYLEFVHNKISVTYLGFRGKFDDSIFKK